MEKLDLFDVSIHERDWKSFKKTATQEELLILGIGVKYRIIKSRILTYLSVLGMILSVVIGLLLIGTDAGLIILIGGYLVFAFLATKSIRYNDSFSQIKRRLSKENKAALKSVFKVSAVAAFFDALFQLIIVYVTIPYQAVMLLIGMIAPNFVISKNGVLIAIPKGYDIGNLGAIGEYYASFSLFDDIEKTSYDNSHIRSDLHERYGLFSNRSQLRRKELLQRKRQLRRAQRR